MLTPYQFASNSPIAHIDLDGLEASAPPQVEIMNNGTPVITTMAVDNARIYNIPSAEASLVLNSLEYSTERDLLPVLGFTLDVGEEGAYSKTFGTWIDKQGHLRPQSYRGNQYSGGKNKFGMRNAKILGVANYGLGLYNVYDIEQEVDLGTLTRGQGNGLQLNNASSTLAPPIYSIPIQIGSEVGKNNAEAEKFALWFTENVMYPMLGHDTEESSNEDND